MDSNKKNKTIYWLGLLGLIPELGAILGIVFIFLGLMKYKDRLLTFIGVLCILYTLILNVVTINLFKSNLSSLGIVEPIVEIKMRDLVKEIESYKIQYGVYPQELEDLLKNGSLISIYDPYQFGNNSIEESKFIYKNKGNKYLLFSVGQDKIANTNDDVYPNFKIDNVNKFGYIIKKN